MTRHGKGTEDRASTRRTKRTSGEQPVKTSIKLDRELWKRAHVKAMDEGLDLQDLIAKAIDAYLRAGGSR